MRSLPVGMNLGATITLALVFLFAFAQIAPAQTPLPLGLDNNYMVTGDYVVGGWTKTTTSNGMSTGSIPIPDGTAYGSLNGQQVPTGADIVAAFLYWQVVESSGVHSGQSGSFRGYPISGAILGNPNAPVSWSSGGCAGSSQGSKTIVTYRAEVSALLPVDPKTGNIQPNALYQVNLPDTGKAGQPPFALGATLVIVYRLLAPGVPLNAVVIYDGSFAPSNTAQVTTQPLLGFYQAGNDQRAPIATKITHIVGNGQTNKLQQVYLENFSGANLVHSTPLPSLYGANPPFPGKYNTTWDNPTWFINSNGDSNYLNLDPINTPLPVQAGESSETTVVVPNGSNKGCVSWGAIIMSTTVQDSDLDGLIDVWKLPANQGYYDAGANRGMSNQGTCTMSQGTCIPKASDPAWVDLSGATPGKKDIFVQLDYMCTQVMNNADGTTTCAPGAVSYKPKQEALNDVVCAYSFPFGSSCSNNTDHNIHVHVIPDDNNVILAQTCTVDANGNLCPHPGQAGVVDWKLGYFFLKTQPLNAVYPDEGSCETQTPVVNGVPGTPGTGPVCVRRFQAGKNNSYHEAIFAVASAIPNWYFQNGSLTSVLPTAGNTLTFTTSNPHGLAADKSAPNGRVTISGAISNPSLNGTYLVGIPLVSGIPSTTSFTIQVPAGTAAPTLASDPSFSVASGAVGSGSGLSDIGGADSLISLGLWGVDGQTRPVESGTFMHELGHSLGLTHGGLYRNTPDGVNYSFSFEPNCKSNFQSVMNYLFQVDLLDGVVLDYSEQQLSALNENSLPGGVTTTDGSALAYSTTKWYTPVQPGGIGSAAKSHCDGTPLSPATDPNPTMYRVEGAANPITPAWVSGSDINFDGLITPDSPPDSFGLRGYDDWANTDLRQIGATGNNFWASGIAALPKVGGIAALPKVGGIAALPKVGGIAALPKVGGIGDFSIKDASSTVRTPTNPSVTLTPQNTVNVRFMPPGFLQSLITGFNVYRSKNGGPFSQLPPNPTVPVVPAATPPLLPSSFTFTDTTVSCGTFLYFVTTVITDTTGITGNIGTRESVPSTTVGPISVPCKFVGFLSPMSTASQAPVQPTFSGSRNLGNAVPVKWELLDANGNPIGDLNTLKVMQACPTMGPTSAPVPSAPCVSIFSPLTGGEGSTTFRFSSPNFIINWDTGTPSGLSHGYWTLELQLSDGRTEWTNLLF